MSAIIISAVLLIIVTGGSLSGFFSRVNSLNGELKEKSAALADACASQALLELANDPSYDGNATTTLSSGDLCRIGPVSTLSGPARYRFRTRAYVEHAYTALEVTASQSDLEVTTYEEIPQF